MIIKDRESSTIILGFIVLMLLLTINLISKFSLIDFTYLLFIVGCFIRYIYIKSN